MRWKEAARYILLQLFFIIKFHYSLRVFRAVLPTIAGEKEYYPSDYVSTEQNEKILNQNRTRRAEKLFEQFKQIRKEIDPTIEVRILASDRKQGYLMQVIGFYLNSFKSRKKMPILTICNTEIYSFEELDVFKDLITIHRIGDRNRSTNINEAIAKETGDYWKCLGIPSQARYLVLIEDDALVVPNFPNFIDSITYQLNIRQEIDYVKLYHPIQLRKLPSIPMTLAIVFSLLLAFQLIVFRKIYFILFLIASLCLYVDVKFYSSQLIADLRFAITGSTYLTVPESCCTPAVLFRQTKSKEIAQTLSKSRSYAGRAKDHILDDSKFIGRQTDSNLVVHIGSFSSVRNRKVKLTEMKDGSVHIRVSKWYQIFT